MIDCNYGLYCNTLKSTVGSFRPSTGAAGRSVAAVLDVRCSAEMKPALLPLAPCGVQRLPYSEYGARTKVKRARWPLAPRGVRRLPYSYEYGALPKVINLSARLNIKQRSTTFIKLRNMAKTEFLETILNFFVLLSPLWLGSMKLQLGILVAGPNNTF